MSDFETGVIATHADVLAEQVVINHAYECLRMMRQHAIYIQSLGYGGGNVHADVGITPETLAADAARKQARIDSLAEPATALCFGRIDRADATRFYIGRRHVQDPDGEPVVTDWRTPVAVPFYRATVADRMGLDQRRRFVIEGRSLIDIFEEDLEHPRAEAAGAYVPDPLLAEVERSRTGSMRDIVATIQSEQDIIIRAPLEQCIVVQGGPGTGKTAVGLHRVAFLLYSHRELLERERVLILGPNKIFFRYISQVLPSLGETAGVQLTIGGLTGGFRVRGDDTAEAAALKGDARMAMLVRRAAIDRITLEATDTPISTAFGNITLDGAAVQAILKQALASNRPLNRARAAVREQLVELGWRTYLSKHGSDPTVWATYIERFRTNAEFKRALDRLWPTLSSADLVRRLYGNGGALRRASDGVFTDDERDLLVRKPSARMVDEAWTTPDLAVLDEAESLLNGVTQQYGHIIIDEAQDLSQMQLRMVARRARHGSMTVLGDLAQATAPGSQSSWTAAIDALATPNTSYEELTVGYRVPAPILAFANALLSEAAPGLAVPTSARTRGEPPRLVATSAASLADAVAREAHALSNEWTSVAIVVSNSLRREVLKGLADAGIEFTDSERTSELGEHVSVLTPQSTKGLEFDAVITVEPARIIDEEVNGIRLLYVVLTRAVQALTVIHAEPLPRALAGQSG